MSPVVTEYEVFLSKTSNPNDGLEHHLGKDLQDIDDVTLIGNPLTKNQYSEWKAARERRDSNRDFYKLLEISTPIAIFTTAYARMLMAKFKIDYGNHLYYSDTDSLILDCPLPDHLTGGYLDNLN
jgi:hypothetical protein